jgi:hypothetical protein
MVADIATTVGNLLVNGSFEATAVGVGKAAGFQSVAGWTALAGGSIELWNALNGVTATQGVNFAELDYVGGYDGFYQDVATTAGQAYTLSFDLRSRPGYAISTQGVEVVWNGQVVATTAPSAAWGTFSVNVNGTGGQDRLTIREVQGQSGDGIGALLDNFRLVAGGTSNKLLSFANQADRAKVVDLANGFWVNAARVLPLGDSNTHGLGSLSLPMDQWEGYRLDLWKLAEKIIFGSTTSDRAAAVPEPCRIATTKACRASHQLKSLGSRLSSLPRTVPMSSS